MKVRIPFVVALFFVVSSVAYSQNVAGMWKGEQAGRGGGQPQEITLDVKVDGNDITGTWMQGEQPEEIHEAMIEEGMLKFKRMITFAGRGGGGAGGEITLNYTGEIEGDQLTLTVEVEGGGFGGRGGGGGGGRGGPAPLVLTRQ